MMRSDPPYALHRDHSCAAAVYITGAVVFMLKGAGQNTQHSQRSPSRNWSLPPSSLRALAIPFGHHKRRHRSAPLVCMPALAARRISCMRSCVPAEASDFVEEKVHGHAPGYTSEGKQRTIIAEAQCA